MRKAFDTCLATFMGYAALKAFGNDDYAGVYFSGLMSAFAAADLLKASRGSKDFISSHDFSTPSIALVTSVTAGATFYSGTIGFEALKDPVDSVMRVIHGLSVSGLGVYVLRERIKNNKVGTYSTLPSPNLKP
jgi:hypothetical protein